VPGRILSVFPAGTMDPPLKLQPLDGHTKVLILAGDRDTTVANIGANQLITSSRSPAFRYKDVRFEVVRSHGFFIADHLSVLSDDPAARRAYWDRADRFLAGS
jgi:dienelactone hydrolase